MIKRKILAIGGGGIGDGTLTEIDSAMKRLSGKNHPTILFFPTAKKDDSSYVANAVNHFESIGCKTQVVRLVVENVDIELLKNQIDDADIIYVGGGSTLYMMRLWRKLGVDVLLANAYHKGKVMAGLSAGAICWFTHGNSDSHRISGGSNKLIRVSGIGLLRGLFCPHYDVEPERAESLKTMTKKHQNEVALAFDDHVAIEIVDSTYRIISNKKNLSVRKVYWREGRYCIEKINVGSEGNINELLNG